MNMFWIRSCASVSVRSAGSWVVSSLIIFLRSIYRFGKSFASSLPFLRVLVLTMPEIRRMFGVNRIGS